MPSPSMCRVTHSRCVLVCASLLGLSVARHLPNTFQEDFETTPDLIVQHGYPMEIHTLASEDGYLLTLHRIPFSGRVRYSSDSQSKRTSHTKGYHKQWQRFGTDVRHRDKSASNKPIVFLQHGVFASSLDWVLTGPDNALGYRMSDAGYDVWMGNLRGNIYSSQHVNMSRKDSQFWDFSWHEIGIYDLPAMIDYVLSVTNQPTLHFIGHSMGATTAVVMLSEKPHYNAKLDLTILLAPVVKLQHNTSILRYSAPFWKAFQTLLPILFGHYPTQTSTRTMAHFMQGMHTGNFSKYDYGPDENMLRYNQSLPLEYNLAKITSPTAIFYGDSDPFTDLKDLNWLANELPNVHGSYRVPSESFSHLSFLWATDVDKTLAVLNPFRATDASILQDNDLAGPLVFCLIFGGLLLLSGKVHFSYIYGIGVLGCLAVYALLTLMATSSVTLGNVISVLGYCLLPMVALSAVNIILSLQGLIGVILTGLAICWCSLSASKLFVTALAMDHQQPLIAYPCALLYGVFALITIF